MDWKAGAVKGWIRSYKALTNLGVFAVAGTIIGFWYSIGDRDRRPTSERLASRARCDKLVRPRRDGQSRAS